LIEKLLILTFPVFFLAPPALDQQLESGQATISAQHRSVRTELDTLVERQDETDLIFSLWQNTINYGRLEAEFVLSRIDDEIKAGSVLLGIRDFWINDMVRSSGFLGDSSIQFRPIRDFFPNVQFSNFFIRGLSGEIDSNRWQGHLFAGKMLDRIGITGYAFEEADELIVGMKYGTTLFGNHYLGGGFLRVENEKDALGRPFINNNNILLLDGKLAVTPHLSILGELLFSLYDQVDRGTVNDFALIAGPQYSEPPFFLYANYRNLGGDFRFVGGSAQSFSNQEGFFASGELRLEKVSLYGSSDYYWDDSLLELDRGRLVTWASNFGISYTPYEILYTNLNSSIVQRKISDGNKPLDELTYSLLWGAFVRLARGRLNPYIRLKYTEDITSEPVEEREKDESGILGFGWQLSRRLRMSAEGEIRRNYDSEDTRDDLIASGNLALRWQPLNRIFVSVGCELINTKDRINDEDSDRLTINLGYGHQLHKGWRVSSHFRWANEWGADEGSDFDLFVKLEKAFHWGRPRLRLGIPRPRQVLITGDIEGYLFIDENGDKRKQPWEKGIPDIPIIMDDTFIVVTHSDGYFIFRNVLTGKRTLTIEIRALPLEYSPAYIHSETDVSVRKTSEVFFPCTIQK